MFLLVGFQNTFFFKSRLAKGCYVHIRVQVSSHTCQTKEKKSIHKTKSISALKGVTPSLPAPLQPPMCSLSSLGSGVSLSWSSCVQRPPVLQAKFHVRSDYSRRTMWAIVGQRVWRLCNPSLTLKYTQMCRYSGPKLQKSHMKVKMCGSTFYFFIFLLSEWYMVDCVPAGQAGRQELNQAVEIHHMCRVSDVLCLQKISGHRERGIPRSTQWGVLQLDDRFITPPTSPFPFRSVFMHTHPNRRTKGVITHKHAAKLKTAIIFH